MPLTNKHRSSIYRRLVPVLGDEETEALLSQFPARDDDEPISREFLRAEVADLRTELHTEMAGLRTELHDKVTDLRTELHTEMTGLRTELHDGLGAFRTEFHDGVSALDSKLEKQMHEQTVRLGGALGAVGTAIVVAITVVDFLG